jgi:hypothetical protein
VSVLLRESAIIVRRCGAESGRFVRRVSSIFQAPRLSPRRRLATHTPAQIDRVEAAAVAQARLAQPGEDVRVRRVPLHPEVLERRVDEQPEGPRARPVVTLEDVSSDLLGIVSASA